MKSSIFFILTVLLFFTFTCKSSKTLTHAKQTDTMEAAEQPIKTVVPENCDTLRLVVGFTVNKKGLVENVKIISSCGDPRFDAEALRVVKASSQWEPAMQRGKPVKVRYHFPMTFVPCGYDSADSDFE